MAQTKQKVFKRSTGHFLLTGVRPGLEQSGLSVQLENHKWEEYNHNQGRSPERSQSNCHDTVPGRSLTVWGGARLFPFTQKQDTGFGTVSQSVSSGILSWSNAKEEGTMEPAMWCSQVPHLQWWCRKEAVYTTMGPNIDGVTLENEEPQVHCLKC